MNKLIVSCLAAALSFAAIAETNTDSKVWKPKRPPRPAPTCMLDALNMRGYKRTGGGVVKPNTEKGLIVFANAQKRVSKDELEKVSKDIFLNIAEFPMKYVDVAADADAEDVKAACKATLVVLIKDDPKLPTSLVAAEDRWAMMNVAKIAQGYKGKEVAADILATRARKEFVRVVCALCGGTSAYEGNVLTAASIEDLDAVEEFIPADIKYRMIHYLNAAGVRPAHVTTYRDACQEGWAPAPTNDVQKRIWDEIHTIPTKPMIIKKEKPAQSQNK